MKTYASVIKSYGRNQSGSIAIIFGFVFVILVGVVGGAVDYGRGVSAATQLQSALDAAALAAGRTYQVTRDTTKASAAAVALFNENLKNDPNSVLTKNEIDTTTKTVRLAARTIVGTAFLAAVGHDTLNIERESSAQLGWGKESPDSYEVVIMTDLSASMGNNSKLNALKEAAKDLINIVVWNEDDQGTKTSKVALAPFSDAVRPGTFLDLVRGSRSSESRFQDNEGRWQNYKLTDCVSERSGNGAYNDIAPFGDDKAGPVYSRPGNCNPGSAIVPLTNKKDVLNNAIDLFQTGGWSAGHLGTAWAWYLISPNWGSVWLEGSQPAPYNDDKVRKIAILMTDGEYDTQYDDAGIQTREHGGGQGGMNGLSDGQARQLCTGMKDAGIEVYTVGFDLIEDKAIETMRLCATDESHAYLAGSGIDLKLAFRNIALSITTLRLSK
jgi:Flp pilus assembly protein TadG